MHPPACPKDVYTFPVLDEFTGVGPVTVGDAPGETLACSMISGNESGKFAIQTFTDAEGNPTAHLRAVIPFDYTTRETGLPSGWKIHTATPTPEEQSDAVHRVSEEPHGYADTTDVESSVVAKPANAPPVLANLTVATIYDSVTPTSNYWWTSTASNGGKRAATNGWSGTSSGATKLRMWPAGNPSQHQVYLPDAVGGHFRPGGAL